MEIGNEADLIGSGQLISMIGVEKNLALFENDTGGSGTVEANDTMIGGKRCRAWSFVNFPVHVLL